LKIFIVLFFFNFLLLPNVNNFKIYNGIWILWIFITLSIWRLKNAFKVMAIGKSLRMLSEVYMRFYFKILINLRLYFRILINVGILISGEYSLMACVD